MAGIGGHIFNRGGPDPSGLKTRTYHGATFTTRFKVSQPVRVTHTGYCGPAAPNAASRLVPSSDPDRGIQIFPMNENEGGAAVAQAQQEDPVADELLAYVRLFIRQSRYNDLSVPDRSLTVYMPSHTKEVDVSEFTGGRIFMVQHKDEGVLLPPGVYFDFGFEIQGKHNHELKFHGLSDDNPTLSYARILHAESGVEFTFLSSSRQLASIAFDTIPVLSEPSLGLLPLDPSTGTVEAREVEGAGGGLEDNANSTQHGLAVAADRWTSAARGITWQDICQPGQGRALPTPPPRIHSRASSNVGGSVHLYDEIELLPRRDGWVNRNNARANLAGSSVPNQNDLRGMKSNQACRLQSETGRTAMIMGNIDRALRQHFDRLLGRGLRTDSPFDGDRADHRGDKVVSEQVEVEVPRQVERSITPADDIGEISNEAGGIELTKAAGGKVPSIVTGGKESLNAAVRVDLGNPMDMDNAGDIDERQVQLLAAFLNKLYRAGLCTVM